MTGGDLLKIFGPAVLVTIICFFAYPFIAPAPPKHLVIGTGPPGSAYFAYGKAYGEIMARDGITLEARNTAGSAENLKRLESKTNGFDIAFVQSGMRSTTKTGRLVSLGSIYFEPVWIFHHAGFEDFELSKEAERFYESGPSFLQRYLPFWVAIFLKRTTVMLLPFVALLFPFFKLRPAIYRWRMRSRIYRWYPRRDAIDLELDRDDMSERVDEHLSAPKR